jgi:NAD-dependent deacetylase
MHGELRILRCEECHETFDMMEEEHLTSEYVPCPNCSNQRLRPHIVWFHEMPFQLPEIYAAVEECDIFMTIGTSGHVYPAAGLIDVAKQSGALCVGVNLDEPINYELHDEFHQGKAGELLPDLIANAIK